MENRRRGLLIASAVLALGVFPITSAASAMTATTDFQYAALGDSYAAGFGLTTPGTGTPTVGCGQNSADYPRTSAAALGIQVTDVSCAGAKTQDLTAAQTTPTGATPAQVDSLSVDTDAVTITIGGNDLDLFSTLAATCNTPATGCFRPAVDQTGTPIPNSFPFTDSDVPFLRGVQEQLDSLMKPAAQAAGFTFISNLAATAAHSACAQPADQYVQGVTLVQSGGNYDVAPSSLHPTAAGTTFLSDQVIPELRSIIPTKTEEPVTPETEAPAANAPENSTPTTSAPAPQANAVPVLAETGPGATTLLVVPGIVALCVGIFLLLWSTSRARKHEAN